jgi:hypothetical protein
MGTKRTPLKPQMRPRVSAEAVEQWRVLVEIWDSESEDARAAEFRRALALLYRELTMFRPWELAHPEMLLDYRTEPCPADPEIAKCWAVAHALDAAVARDSSWRQ